MAARRNRKRKSSTPPKRQSSTAAPASAEPVESKPIAPKPERRAGELPPWYDRRLWQITPIRDAMWIFAVLGTITLGIWIGYELRAIFTPVLIALALAYLFDPVITACERRWDIPRPATIGGVLGILLITMTVFTIVLGGKLVDQVRDLATDTPEIVEQLTDMVAVKLNESENGVLIEVDPSTSEKTEPAPPDYQSENSKSPPPKAEEHQPRSQLEEITRAISEDPVQFAIDRIGMILGGAKAVSTGAGSVTSAVWSFFGTTTAFLVSAALVPVYFFFFAWQFGPIRRYWRQFIPATKRQRTLEIIGRMDNIVATYFRARVVIALVMGVMFSVGWWMCGIKYWLIVGMASGMLSLIPYASVVGWPIAVILAYFSSPEMGKAVADAVAADGQGQATQAGATFDWMAVFLWPSVVYIVVQMFEGWLLTPWIQGKSLDMSAVTILIVVFIGGAVGGLYGLILCIPLAACAKILLVELVLPRIKRWSMEN